MRAALSRRYGGPEQIEVTQIETPRPGPGEVVIKLHATTVSRTDCGMLRGYPWFMRLSAGLFAPRAKVLGVDFAGTVAAIGEGVGAYAPGDRVFGLSPERFGAHAEYLCLPVTGPMALLPEGIEFADAVLCEGAWYAETYLQDFGIGPGDRILIYGASGAIGTAAVQLAKARGAEVTAVVGTRHVDLARELGADRVIDYQKEAYLALDERFNFILDAVGKASYFQCRKLLLPDGRFAATDLGAGWQNIWLSLWFGLIGSTRLRFPMPRANPVMIARFASLMRAGQLKAVIDRCYGLNEIVAAYRYVETAQKTGIVILDPVAQTGGETP
ncbi:NAD(P)-dependent alcohol dehydrogenase [Roseovarius faecimaris]|uniref:NAD(P)-dependent alcohol dehydrogenase n=2 Tax=Roseovarius faecimaris TaxID=2494550 RepID=A0A6I6IXV9_9RHOB|nr:NAD(P)-dependent alcohol dehydrogenase [Roseovarius faecimaris]